MREISYSKILVPTDGSDYSCRAGEHAAYLARMTGGRVYILNVIDTGKAFRSGIHYAQDMCELEQHGSQATGKIKDICVGAGVPCEEIVARGKPADVIIGTAENLGVDCIVIGSIGMSAIERILIGSVSEHVVRHARCPVLLIRQ
jgi:nucleotide-binding universal stress UspA family protein